MVRETGSYLQTTLRNGTSSNEVMDRALGNRIGCVHSCQPKLPAKRAIGDTWPAKP